MARQTLAFTTGHHRLRREQAQASNLADTSTKNIMDLFLQNIYLEYAKDECQACFNSVAYFNAALQSQGREEPFRHAHDFINRAAAVSRIFWPSWCSDEKERRRAQKRGEFLRKVLSLEWEHPVRSKTLRNHLEHFDARLDKWAEESKHRSIVTTLIGPRSAISGKAINDEDIIHHYDPETKIYAFRGEKFNLQELATGIDDIHSRIQLKIVEIKKERIRKL